MAELVKTNNPLFIEAAELYTQDPNLVVVGSVGRAAITGASIEPYRPSGVPRDIDVVRMGDRSAQLSDDPDKIDTLFESWIAEDGSYLVFPHDPTLYVPVKHPEVFRPHVQKVQGLDIPTPHHDVLGKINTMQYIQRPKDKKAATEYGAYLKSIDDHLPDELLKPFDELRTALSERKGYIARGAMRNGYHYAMPEPLRKKVHLGERLHWLRKH
jgi:hypothetical protein